MQADLKVIHKLLKMEKNYLKKINLGTSKRTKKKNSFIHFVGDLTKSIQTRRNKCCNAIG